MKCYINNGWNFSLDIPVNWDVFPPVLTNSPFEVIRFVSREDGTHMLVVFREPYDPKRSVETHSQLVEAKLEKLGFSNFVPGKAIIGPQIVATLNFDKPLEDGIWSCRHYFMANSSTLMYVLGFGTTNWNGMSGLFGRMTQSFTAETAAEPD